jgi:hypothetical protein
MMNDIRTALAAGAMCLLIACGGGDGSSGGGALLASGSLSSASERETPAVQGVTTAPDNAAAIAKTAGGASGDAVRPLAQSAYSRDHTYRFFSANGTEQVLRLDFQSRRFELLGASASVSGSFNEDPTESGSFVFVSPRSSGTYATARFRVAGDTVVGAFPVRPAYGPAQALETLPFIAPRDFVSDAAEIDGSYAPLETNRASTGTAGGGVISTRITDAGTRMTICMSSSPYTIESCPNGLTRTYVLQQSGDLWHAASTTAPADNFDFRIAKVNGEKIYLSVGVYRDLMDLGGPARTGLRVGVPATSASWPLTYGIGAVGDGRWGRYALDGTQLTATSTDATGTTATLTAATTPAGNFSRALPAVAALNPGAGSPTGYAVQNRTLFLAWGAAPGTGPGLSIAQITGTNSDSRNGSYVAFGLTGRRYGLRVDFDAGTYTLTDDATLHASGIVRRAQQGGAALGAYEFVRTDSGAAPTVSQFSASTLALSGSLPIAAPGSSSLEPTGFVAARSFVDAQSELSAMTTLYGYTLSTRSDVPFQASSGLGFRQSGKVLLECVNMLYVPGTPLETCPSGQLMAYNVSAGPTAGTWHAAAGDGRSFDFQVGRIGADLILLQAGSDVFRVGLGVAEPWRNMGAIGVGQSYGPYDPSYLAIESTLCTPALCSAMQFTPSSTLVPTFSLSGVTYSNAPALRFSPAGTTSYVHHQGRNVLIRHRGGNGRHLFVGFGQGV